jgi:hypothetical protein
VNDSAHDEVEHEHWDNRPAVTLRGRMPEPLPVWVATLTPVWNRDGQPPVLLYVAFVPVELVVG